MQPALPAEEAAAFGDGADAEEACPQLLHVRKELLGEGAPVEFYAATAFDQNIGVWNTSSVTTMQDMFHYVNTFDQNIGSWNVSSVENMSSMFAGAGNGANSGVGFDQDISVSDVSSVTDMGFMFYSIDLFNQDISGWNVTNVTDWYAFNSGGASLEDDNIPEKLKGTSP